MDPSQLRSLLSAESDPTFDQLVCRITAELELGREIDIVELQQLAPAHASRLLELLPTLKLMAELTTSSANAAHEKNHNQPELKDSVLGEFRIYREVGRGGMGVVYEAEEIPLARRVALKILPFANVLDSRRMQRFQNEARAAASLQHPHIVPVFSVGCERGVHFYAMQFIDGQSLEKVIQQRREERNGPRDFDLKLEGLPLPTTRVTPLNDGALENSTKTRPEVSAGRGSAGRDSVAASPSDRGTVPIAKGSTERSKSQSRWSTSIAQSIADVAEALHHAHESGVIHRDIKPANLMFDASGKIWVTDFGLAHIESNDTLTISGDLLGTLRYMSPEQAGGHSLAVDHRSDIYSLGVTLHELLTLQPAFSSRDRKQLLHDVLNLEPPSIRQLDKALSVELEIIVSKAMAKDPTDRYQTAADLAADLRRFVKNEPILARPPTRWQRGLKWCQRHVAIVAIVATAVGLLTLTTAVSSVVLWNQAARLTEALADTEASQKDAVEQAIIARRETKQKEEALEQEQRQRKEAERQKQLAETQTQRAQSAETLAGARLQTAERNLSFARHGNEILGAVFADLDPNANYTEVSDLRNALGDNLNRAIAQLQATEIGEPQDVASMQSTLGRSLLGLGETEDAIEVLRQALAAYKEALGPDHLDTLACVNHLAMGYKAAGRIPEAVQLWKQTLEKVRLAAESDPFLLLSVMSNLADGLLAAGQLEKALDLKKETLELTRTTLGPDDPKVLTTMNNLAAGYRAIGRLDLALPLLLESLELLQTKLGPDHPDTLASINNLASAYRSLGQMEKAMPLHRQAVERRTVILGPDHPDTLISINNLAVAHLAKGELDLALPLFEENLEVRIEKLGAEHPDTLLSMHNLAGAYAANEQTDRAFPLWEKALEIRLTVLGAEHPDTIATLGSLARGYQDNERAAEAVPLLEQAVKAAKQTFGLEHPQVLSLINNLAMAYRSAGQIEKALPLLEQVLNARTKQLGEDHPSTMVSVHNLADGYLAAKRIDDVIPLLDTLSLRLGPDHEYTRRTSANLMRAWAANRIEATISLLRDRFRSWW
ncbi:MAG: tetratricopeptide repeat protein [Planctomycetaceae bacterium]|nr:tetratricopeptide repeat protein [Planctomycetaceae bacterium]